MVGPCTTGEINEKSALPFFCTVRRSGPKLRGSSVQGGKT